jgi:hypothetical protein
MKMRNISALYKSRTNPIVGITGYKDGFAFDTYFSNQAM